jgi:heme exporter protein C
MTATKAPGDIDGGLSRDAADRTAPPDGAFPLLGGSPGAFFVPQAVATLALFALLNVLIAGYAPFSVKEIGASYLIQYYHVPSAISMYLAYFMVCVSGIMVLVSRSPDWDRRARAFAAVGLLANGIVVATGSVWGKAAWNVWWRFDDPKLTTAAIQFLIYLAYLVVARGVEDETRRPRICAIYGILAAPMLVFVHFAVQWFGSASHPERVKQMGTEIPTTLGTGMLTFLFVYLLLYRWKYDMETIRDRADAALTRIRRLEDSRS